MRNCPGCGGMDEGAPCADGDIPPCVAVRKSFTAIDGTSTLVIFDDTKDGFIFRHSSDEDETILKKDVEGFIKGLAYFDQGTKANVIAFTREAWQNRNE